MACAWVEARKGIGVLNGEETLLTGELRLEKSGNFFTVERREGRG